MKVKVNKKSFYNNKLNKVGDIIEINEDKLPSWAESLDCKESKEIFRSTQNDGERAQNGKEKQPKIDELSKLKPDEIKVILDNLLNEAIEKGILIDFENKSDIALIIELTDALEGKK